jgi:hypothetical protein
MLTKLAESVSANNVNGELINIPDMKKKNFSTRLGL